MEGHSDGPAGLSVGQVLAMPAVRNADPQVLAGSDQLHREVRWVHTTELVDIAPLLRGGDLVLTTGIALPDNSRALGEFARSLEESQAAGLLLELGRRWTAAPASLVDAAATHGLPLVVLRRETRFAAVAQAVGEHLIDAQVRELRETHRVHDTFTELSVAEAGPGKILDAVQRLAGTSVVLEDAGNRVLDFRAGPDDPALLLEDWQRRSRRVQSSDRTSWDASNRWLTSVIGRHERRWGRLVIANASAPTPRLTAVVERGAAALALHRLHDRSNDGRVRRAHHDLLLSMQDEPPSSEHVQRAAVIGFPSAGRRLVGLAVRPSPAAGPVAAPPDVLAAQLDDVVTASLRAAELSDVAVVVAAFETDVRLLLSLPARLEPVLATNAYTSRLIERVPHVLTIGAGSTVASLREAGRSLRESSQVLSAVASAGEGALHRLTDLRVRGLLTLLSEDDRVSAFTERELAPLIALDADEKFDVLRTARVVIDLWGSKSASAAALNVSRPVLYDRIRRIEDSLGASLDDAEVRTSLHLAFLSSDTAR